jgi:hypothetical protein
MCAPACTAHEDHALLNDVSEQLRECLQHAEDCARKAAAQTDPALKADFLDMERRWLSLARSYELTGRVSFSAVSAKKFFDQATVTRGKTS